MCWLVAGCIASEGNIKFVNCMKCFIDFRIYLILVLFHTQICLQKLLRYFQWICLNIYILRLDFFRVNNKSRNKDIKRHNRNRFTEITIAKYIRLNNLINKLLFKLTKYIYIYIVVALFGCKFLWTIILIASPL